MSRNSRRTFLKQALVMTGAALPLSGGAFSSDASGGNRPVAPLKDAMTRVSRCCLAWLNPTENHRPTGGYEVAHDTGRWWDAMLRYEARTGDRIPGDIEKAMMDNLRAMTDNPAALLMNASSPPETRVINLHNIRETMHTYAALTQYRKSDWACTQGKRLIACLADRLTPDGQVDYPRLRSFMDGRTINPDPMMCPEAPPGGWFDSTGTTGRAIEALLHFSEAAGDTAGLDLAARLAATHLRMVVDESGRTRPELLDTGHVGHNHSYCGTLRGLLLYGLMTKDRKYVDAVSNTYRHGLWGTTISPSGWTPHDLGKLRFPNEDGDPVGEHGSCADVMVLGLWLGLKAGHTDLLDDVERLIRARLLPSQMKAPDTPRNDGAWGVYGHPFGFGSILDVFAAVLHGLVDVDAHAVTESPDGGCSVNLHFSCDTPLASIAATRGETASVAIIPRRRAGLRVRIPSWVPRETVQISSGGRTLSPHWDASWLTVDVADLTVDRPVVLEYGLPRKETTEVMPVSKREFHLSWQGDTVVACSPSVPIYAG